MNQAGVPFPFKPNKRKKLCFSYITEERCYQIFFVIELLGYRRESKQLEASTTQPRLSVSFIPASDTDPAENLSSDPAFDLVDLPSCLLGLNKKENPEKRDDLRILETWTLNHLPYRCAHF